MKEFLNENKTTQKIRREEGKKEGREGGKERGREGKEERRKEISYNKHIFILFFTY